MDELDGTSTESAASAPRASSPTYLPLPITERVRTLGIIVGLNIGWRCTECDASALRGSCRACGWGPTRPLHSSQFRVPAQIDYGKKLRLPAAKFGGGRLPGGDYYIEVTRA